MMFWFQAPAPGQTPSPQLLHCASVLDTVVKVAPGLQQAVFFMAKVRFLSGVLFRYLCFLFHVSKSDFGLSGESPWKAVMPHTVHN